MIGQSQADAITTLEDAGYSVKISSSGVRSDQPEGNVAAVNPDPGSRLPEGATVNVFLSDG